MKSHHLFLILIVTLLSSCTDDEHGSELYNRINPIILENPDSALHVLECISSEIDTSDEAMKSYYTLLTIKAKDKAYIVHQSDSAILTTLPYFEKHTERLPEAYYYAGRVYSDMGDAPEALNYFQKALDLLPEDMESKETLKLKTVILSQIGLTYKFQNMYHESRACFLKAFVVDSLLNDTTNMVISLLDIGNSFRCTKDFDSSKLFYDRAEKICEISRNENDLADVLSQMSRLYYDQNKYDQALSYFNRIKGCDDESMSGINAMGGLVYYALGNLDSAKCYWQKNIQEGALSAKAEAYAGMANIEMQRGNLDTATKYINKYIYLSDSMRSIMQVEAVINANKFYNYQHKQKEINALKLQNIRKNYSIVVVICLLTIILLLFCSIVRHMRIKQLNADIQMARYQRLLEKMESKEHAHVTLQKEDGENKSLMSNLLCLINLLVEREKIMNDDDWRETKRVIGIMFPSFLSSLYELRFLNETDMHISMLLKLGFMPNVIAKLLGRDKSTITASRKKLAQKTFGTDKVAKDWDAYINTL